MRTKRIYVSYDVRDPEEARMQEVLNGLGRRRAEILKAVFTHLANIYGFRLRPDNEPVRTCGR